MAAFQLQLLLYSIPSSIIQTQSGAVRGKMLVLYFSAGGLSGLWGSVGLGLKALLRCHSLLLNMRQVLARSSSSPPVLHSLPSLPPLPSLPSLPSFPSLPVTARSQRGFSSVVTGLHGGLAIKCVGRWVCLLCVVSAVLQGEVLVLKLKIQNFLSVVLHYNFVNTNMLFWLLTRPQHQLFCCGDLMSFFWFKTLILSGFVFLSVCHEWLGCFT